MKEFQQHLHNVYKYVLYQKVKDEQQEQLTSIAKLRDERKIDFEEYIKKIINVFNNSLIAGNAENNKEMLYYIYSSLVLIHESRWTDKCYGEQIKISESIREEECRLGLGKDEFFRRGEGSEKLIRLNKKYDNLFKNKEKEVFNEFFSPDILKKISSQLRNIGNERQEYIRKLENTKHQTSKQEKVKEISLMDMYYQEFEKCYQNKIYVSSVIMLGAAFESLLLYLIGNNDSNLSSIIKDHSTELHAKKIEKMGLSDLIKVSYYIGLMPKIHYNGVSLLLDQMSESLRSGRNIIHPGKILRESEFVIPSFVKQDIDVLNSTFQIVKNWQNHK